MRIYSGSGGGRGVGVRDGTPKSPVKLGRQEIRRVASPLPPPLLMNSTVPRLLTASSHPVETFGARGGVRVTDRPHRYISKGSNETVN